MQLEQRKQNPLVWRATSLPMTAPSHGQREKIGISTKRRLGINGIGFLRKHCQETGNLLSAPTWSSTNGSHRQSQTADTSCICRSTRNLYAAPSRRNETAVCVLGWATARSNGLGRQIHIGSVVGGLHAGPV